MGQQRILCILGNYHGIIPQVCTFVRHPEAHIFIFRLDICGVTAVNYGDILVAVHHTVDNFIRYIGRIHLIVHIQQPFIGFVNFILIVCVHGVTQCFQRHHEGVTFGVIDIDLTCVIFIAQYFKALCFHHCRIHIVMVIDDTHTAPEIRNRICVIRVIRQVSYLRCQVIQIRDKAQIQFLQTVFLHHTLDHIVRRDDNVIGIARLHFGVHHFVGIEIFHDNIYAVFFFKGRDQVFTHIFAGDIQFQCIGTIFFDGILRRCTAAMEGIPAKTADTNNDRKSNSNSSFANRLTCFTLFFTDNRQYIHNDQRNRNEDDNQCRQGVDGRIYTFTHCVNQNGNILYAITCYEVRDNEIVEGHGECDQGTGYDTGHDLRHDDFCQGLKRCCTQVHSRIRQVRIQRTEFWHD